MKKTKNSTGKTLQNKSKIFTDWYELYREEELLQNIRCSWTQRLYGEPGKQKVKDSEICQINTIRNDKIWSINSNLPNYDSVTWLKSRICSRYKTSTLKERNKTMKLIAENFNHTLSKTNPMIRRDD